MAPVTVLLSRVPRVCPPSRMASAAAAAAQARPRLRPLRRCLSLSSSSVPSPPPDRPLRWGIVSAGLISTDYARAVASTPGHEVGAVAARCPDRAGALAGVLGVHHCPKAYGGSDAYSALLSDPSVDVVYVGTVAEHHLDVARASLAAGKPTVVEKPLTVGLAGTVELAAAARRDGIFLMEGLWTRCFPAMAAVGELLRSGAIGRCAVVQADFGWSTRGAVPVPGHRVWHPESGGLVLDVGMNQVHGRT